jgi:uncharacterized protein YdhG (YjbR/CyaY superfamily)
MLCLPILIFILQGSQSCNFLKDRIINLASMNKSHETVDAYIATFPESTQLILRKIRSIIKKTAPEAIENMAYGMPAYKIKGKPLVYFAGYKNHIGFYATPTGHEAFAEELSIYKQGKGSVQFPLTASRENAFKICVIRD